MRHAVTCLAVSLLWFGCDPVDPLIDASLDATLLDGGDSGVRPSDGGMSDASTSDAASGDASPPDSSSPDAEADAGLTCVCELLECTIRSCVPGPIEPICELTQAPDGTPCGLFGAGMCVAGVCAFGGTGCGDGFREPGPTPPREGCDDGNILAGDACAPDCTPSVLVVASRAAEQDVPGAIAVAEDGTGMLLFVWTASRTDMGMEDLEIHARRASAAGVMFDLETTSPILIDGSLGLGWFPHVVVTGLSGGGWVVAWAAPDGDGSEAGIRYRSVRPDGTTRAPRTANQYAMGPQTEPVIARGGSGFVIAWTDKSGTLTSFGAGRVLLRSFDALGGPLGDESLLSPSGPSALEPYLSSDGDRILATWTEEPEDITLRPRIVARRLGGATPDSARFVVSDTDGSEGSSSPLASGDFAVTWVGRSDDFRGDIRSRTIRATGDPLAGTSVLSLTSSAPLRAELAPAIAAFGSVDTLVAYEDDGNRQGVLYLPTGAATLPPEAPTLSSFLTAGLQGDVTLLTTSRGTWFLWSDSGPLGDPGSLRSFLAYLLPPS